MNTGVISEFDSEGQFGLIDADDGHLVLFNLRNVEAARRDQFRIGTRVSFDELSAEPAPRAAALEPVVQPT